MVAPESTTDLCRFFFADLDVQDDESLVTFMLLGCDGGSTCGGDCTWGMCDGTPSMSMHEAIITERNKRVFLYRHLGTDICGCIYVELTPTDVCVICGSVQ